MRLWVSGAVKLIHIQIFEENKNTKKEKWELEMGRATSKIRRIISFQMKQRLTSPAAAASALYQHDESDRRK